MEGIFVQLHCVWVRVCVVGVKKKKKKKEKKKRYKNFDSPEAAHIMPFGICCI